jgi:DNA-binding NtrC family response regulator
LVAVYPLSQGIGCAELSDSLELLFAIYVWFDRSEGEHFMEPERALRVDTESWTILLVEDDSLIRLLTAEHLRGVGFDVVEAVTAEDAVAVLSSGVKVHLVFSDVSLPGAMGGFALAVWVRHHFRSIPVVLTSGVDSAVRPLDRQSLIPFLSKPYRMEDAEKLIASVLAKSLFARR